jgi:enterochelin esterase-like enzyme
LLATGTRYLGIVLALLLSVAFPACDDDARPVGVPLSPTPSTTIQSEAKHSLASPTTSPASASDHSRIAALAPTSTPLPLAHDCPHAWQPVCVTHYPWQSAELRSRWDAAGSPIWIDGDIITIAWQGDADEVFLRGTFEQPLVRVPNSDLWAVTLRVPNIAAGLIDWGIAAFADGTPVGNPDQRQYWRGPAAPAALALPDDLAGTVQDFVLDAATLGGRDVTVYLPPGFDRTVEYPVVYLADGQTTAGFAAAIDPLIVIGELPAVVLVGEHAALGDDDPRSKEYLVSIDDERFAAHERFFVDELAAWARANFHVAADPARVAVFGFSSGASYAVALGVRHPDRYGIVLAFSHGWDRGFRDPEWPGGTVPRYYFVNGTLEEGFRQKTRVWAGIIRQAGGDVVHVERVAGHDYLMWQEEFPAALAWAFGVF